MKKIFFYGLMLGMSVLGLTSCSDDYDKTDSRLTYYVNLEVQGEEFVQVPIGTSYTDAGCKATMNGQDATNRIVTFGLDEIDVNTAGLYTVTYTAINDDGFSASATRTVAVCDPTITTDISGTWTVQAGSYRLYNGNQTPYADFTVKIRRDAPGISMSATSSPVGMTSVRATEAAMLVRAMSSYWPMAHLYVWIASYLAGLILWRISKVNMMRLPVLSSGMPLIPTIRSCSMQF